MMISLLAAALSLFVIGSFWFVIWVFWSHLFYVRPTLEETEEEQNTREQDEELILKADLEGLQENQGVNIVRVAATAARRVRDGRETLLNLGIAENRTLARQDDERVDEGDHWLCDGRPLIFALIQFPLVWLMSWGLMASGITPLAATAVSFLLVTLIIGILSVTTVPENHRLGVKLFGKQRRGFLGSGLQFLVLKALHIIEVGQLVPLTNMVWGPGAHDLTKEAEKLTALRYPKHMPGALGTPQNPSPGKFTVALFGRWQIEVTLTITLRARRSSREAWYYWLNKYSSLEEVGEQIAAVSNSVLTTRIREIDTREQVQGDRELYGEDAETYAAAGALIDFLDNVPEISGDILLALLELGRERLAGILPVNVVFSSIMPDQRFRELFERLDEAKVDKLRQKLVGESEVNRLQRVREFAREVSGGQENPDMLVQLETLFTQRQFAQAPSGLDTIVKSFGLQQTQQATQPTQPRERRTNAQRT